MDYSSLAKTSIRLIRDKGRMVTYVYKTQGTYQPQTDTLKKQFPSDQSVKIVFTNFSRKDMDGTLVKVGDCVGLLAPDNLAREPKTADQIKDGTEIYTVVDFVAIAPGDTVLLYKLHLRKGG